MMDQHITQTEKTSPAILAGRFPSQDDAAVAVIEARPSLKQAGACGLIWEVYAEGQREPLRYGLCLARPEEGYQVRVPVVGLSPGRSYRYQLVLDGDVVATGLLCASERLAS